VQVKHFTFESVRVLTSACVRECGCVSDKTGVQE